MRFATSSTFAVTAATRPCKRKKAVVVKTDVSPQPHARFVLSETIKTVSVSALMVIFELLRLT